MWRWICVGCWTKGGWVVCFGCELNDAHGWSDEWAETDWHGCKVELIADGPLEYGPSDDGLTTTSYFKTTRKEDLVAGRLWTHNAGPNAVAKSN